jgi:hypothetical protein
MATLLLFDKRPEAEVLNQAGFGQATSRGAGQIQSRIELAANAWFRVPA